MLEPEVSWHTANDAVLAEGHRVLIDDPTRFDGVAVINVTHVEVFQMGSVRTSILGRPQRPPGHRHYTLNCDEP